MRSLEQAALDALESVVLTPTGLEELESQRRTFLQEALRKSDGEAREHNERHLKIAHEIGETSS